METKIQKSVKRRKRFLKIIGIILISIIALILGLALLGNLVEAAGLVDEKINTANEYSKYSLDNYQLDFYVDNSWSWLPWNWGSGIGKQVMYGLYAITNFIWTISLYISNATGYLVQEAYNLDFISKTANSIGTNMQTLAGITKNGFSSSGFYVGFLLILILILGAYVAYVGLIKRETTKVVKAVINFVVIFIVSASFIAYAPDYITRINDFSKDVSNASLNLGTKLVLPNSKSKGKASVNVIRDSLYSIQVQQPWLLLQYGTTDTKAIGEKRVEKLMSTSPTTNDGKDREDIVIEEIEKHNNLNLSLTKTINRLGTVFFLFFFNIGISIFVFLLTGVMIFSQILFIILAMFLPISFLLSMIPSFEGMSKKAIMKLFNVIMTRAGITLIISIAFSISTMLYALSNDTPFFMIMFLQIITFAGIYFKLGDLMSMFSLQNNGSQQVGRRFLRAPRVFINRHTRAINRKLGKTMANNNSKPITPTKTNIPANHERNVNVKQNIGNKMGKQVGNALDSKAKLKDKASNLKDNVKNAPTNTKYAMHKGRQNVKSNIHDFSDSINKTREHNHNTRLQKKNHQRENISIKKQELTNKHQSKRVNVKTNRNGNPEL